MQAMQAMQQGSAATQRAMNVAASTRALVNMDSGVNKTWLGLHGQCLFSDVLSEKVVKGGTSNIQVESYVYVIYPFSNISQVTPDDEKYWRSLCQPVNVNTTSANKRKEVEVGRTDEVEGTDKATEVLDIRVNDTNATGNATNSTARKKKRRRKKVALPSKKPVVLGYWSEWATPKAPHRQEPVVLSTDVDDVLGQTPLSGDNGIAMRFAQGDGCEGGIKRQVDVSFVCGDVDRILTVNEDGMCVYEMVVETTVACSHQRAEMLRDEAQEMIRFSDSETLTLHLP